METTFGTYDITMAQEALERAREAGLRVSPTNGSVTVRGANTTTNLAIADAGVHNAVPIAAMLITGCPCRAARLLALRESVAGCRIES
jgi:hypothetical protein